MTINLNPVDIAINIVILFLIMSIGYISNKAGFINREVQKGLSNIVLNLTTPAVIISSFHRNFVPEMLDSALTVLLFAFLILLFWSIAGQFFYIKFKPSEKKVLWYSAIFSNCGFMGYPILQGIFGNDGIFYGSVFIVVFTFFTWTAGQFIYTGEKSLKMVKNALINPGTIAIVIAAPLFLFSLKLPVPVIRCVEMVGGMNSPLSMMAVGAMLAQSNILEVFKGWKVYYGTFVKLFVVPLITFFILNLLNIDKTALLVCCILTAMPIAANTALFAEKNGADSAFASRCVFISTLLSIISLPVIVMIINLFLK